MVKVREIMKREVIKITPKETIADAAKIMTTNQMIKLDFSF